VRLHCSTAQAIQVWNHLVRAWTNTSTFADWTSEVYAYLLFPYRPSMTGARIAECIADSSSIMHKDAVRMESNARQDLATLCREFAEEYEVEVTIDGRTPDIWERCNDLFVHRVHICVMDESSKEELEEKESGHSVEGLQSLAAEILRRGNADLLSQSTLE